MLEGCVCLLLYLHEVKWKRHVGKDEPGDPASDNMFLYFTTLPATVFELSDSPSLCEIQGRRYWNTTRHRTQNALIKPSETFILVD